MKKEEEKKNLLKKKKDMKLENLLIENLRNLRNQETLLNFMTIITWMNEKNLLLTPKKLKLLKQLSLPSPQGWEKLISFNLEY